MSLAACTLAILGLFALKEKKTNDNLLSTIQSVNVPAGNRTNIALPDGSSVWLSSNSKLTYPVAFTGKKREVTLDGEGYFEVAKGKKPFIVKTSKYNIEVLGTVFNVEAYGKSERFARTDGRTERERTASFCYGRCQRLSMEKWYFISRREVV